jgi:predicted PurR-regulated permease PerM
MALNVFGQTRSGDEIIQLAVRLGLLAFLLYWSFVLVRPFIPILAWSLVLTVALYPPYEWLSVHLGSRPKLAAAIVTVINLAIVIGPVTCLGVGLVEGLQSFAGQLSAGSLAIPSPPGWCQGLADRWWEDLQPLGPCFDKSAGCPARGGAAVETFGRSRALLCRQCGLGNA